MSLSTVFNDVNDLIEFSQKPGGGWAEALIFANGSFKVAKWLKQLLIGVAWTRPQDPYSKNSGSQT